MTGRIGMKKTLLLLLMSAITSTLVALNDGDVYFPLNEKSVWLYDVYHKNSGEMIRGANMDIVGRVKMDGREYICIHSVFSGGIFSVRTDDSGVYIKTLRQQLPFLSFLTYDIEFIPELCFIKFPIKMGDSWEYRGQAALKALNIVDLRRDIYARFLVAGREKINVMGKEINSYHVVLYADRGGGEKKLYRGELWFGENTGYVMGDTDDAHFELIQYYFKLK
jgi:hypothetical protein